MQGAEQSVIAIAVGCESGLDVDGPVEKGHGSGFSRHHSLVLSVPTGFQDGCCHERSAG